jgi:flavodoxin
MYEVIYFSRSGNTGKVANEIAEELNVKSRHIVSVKSLPEGVDLFLGSGLYFLRPAKQVRDFIRNNDFQGRRIALFGTSTTGIGIEIMGMKRLLKRKGAIIVGAYYCPGKFSFVRKGQPANRDLVKAREFVRSVRNRFCDNNMDSESPKEKHENRILSRV